MPLCRFIEYLLLAQSRVTIYLLLKSKGCSYKVGLFDNITRIKTNLNGTYSY